MGFWAAVAVEVLWVLALSGWLLLEKRSPTATLAWIFGLAWLPLLGVPVYLVLGPRRLQRKKLRLLKARELVARSALDLTELSARARDHLAPLMRLATRLDGLPPMRATALRVLDGGDETYAAIEEAIRGARRHVHCEYYIFRDDQTGQRLLAALMDTARRGVEVRLLVDGLGSRLSRATRRALAAAGVKFAWFNPLLMARLPKGIVNFRTHRKIVVIDGVVGFTGGINVTDDHSAQVRGAQAWRDTHLEVRGEAVQGLQRTFLENWVFASREALGPARFADLFPACDKGEHLVQVLASGPDSPNRAIWAYYVAAIGMARRTVWLTTPYLVPDEALLAALCLAAGRGVDVQLVVPRKTDAPMVDLAGASFHDALLQAGVRIHMFGPPMVHAKTAVIDGELALVGTANLDDRSMRLNFEVLVACYGGPVVARLEALFQRDREGSRLKLSLEDRKSVGSRLLQSFARLFAPQL